MTWRRSALVLGSVALVLGTIAVLIRADGFPGLDATTPRATRWFVDRDNGSVILADGFAGATLARLQLDAESPLIDVAQSPSGVMLVDRSTATARSVDAAGLRLGPVQSVGLVSAPDAVVGVGQSGLVAVDPESQRAVVLASGGEPVSFDTGPAGLGDDTRIAPDGAVFTLGAGALARVTTNGRELLASGLSSAGFTLVGSAPLTLDVDRRRVRFDDGGWQPLPDDVPASEYVLQEPGPAGDCGWIGGDDRLLCIGRDGVVESRIVDGLAIDGADLLSVAGDVGVIVRRATSRIARFDWRSEEMLVGDDQAVASVPAGAELRIASAVDLVWIDDVAGRLVWAIHPWGVRRIFKDDARAPLLGESGEVIDAGGDPGVSRGVERVVAIEEREPDDNGLDDPPVAVPDPVTARTGAAVPVTVTANDYDPDGEAIAVVEVTAPARGTVDIADADTVVYLPAAGFVGFDEFTYTIVDGDGTPATAAVTIELLPLDAVNQAPVGGPDFAETGPDVPAVIDVLTNDVDPERDSLRVSSFAPADVGGSVTETVGPSGLPALRYQPPVGVSGTATFSYRPVDSFGAIGAPVQVTVEIAQPGDANRPPIVRPDAVRTRRDIPAVVAVLANDRDPDGDTMAVEVVRPLPPGIEVRPRGEQLEVTVRTGAERLSPFRYVVDDGHGNRVTGSVLVVQIDEREPNRPPIANADTDSIVAGATKTIDVLVNDTDPDGDPIILTDATQPEQQAGSGSVAVRGDVIEYTASPEAGRDELIDRFTYTIADGNGNEATGEVTVRVLADTISLPPYARDDSATTDVDVPVTIDVLGNDGDPSGERPTILSVGCASGGSTTITADEKVRFVPPAAESGLFRCIYEVTNSQQATASAAIVVSVLPPTTLNVPPVVSDEELTIVIGETRTVDVLANDRDPDGSSEQLRVVASTTPVIGTAQRDGGLITFTAGTSVGDAVITYQVADEGGGVATGRLQIRIVEPDPVPPVAVDDRRTITGPAVPTVIDVIANDSDADGPNAELFARSAEVIGGDASVTVSGRTVTIDARPEFVGDVTVRYEIADADGLSDEGLVVLTVLERPNRPPTARDDTATVVNGGRISINLASNDEDLDGDSLTYSLVSGTDSDLGVATLADRTLVFDAEPGASGRAVAEYAVSDGEATTQAFVLIDVLPCAQALPDAPDVFLQTGYEQPIFIDLTTVSRNGDVVEVGAPLSAPSGVYTPPPGENGNVSFTYLVRNVCRLQDIGRVTIDVNQAPLGAPFETQLGRSQQTTIPVSALASDLEQLVITALEGGGASVGIVDAGRAVSVTAPAQPGRIDTVAVISDPGGLQVRVPIGVVVANLAPVAVADQVRLGQGQVTFAPLANDSDPDGDAITLQSVPATLTFPNGGVGTITRIGNDQLRIDPGTGVGVASFTYTIVDAFNLESAPASVTVTVNTPPIAPPVDVLMVAATTAQVVVGASDPDGDALTLSLGQVPPDLTITVDGLTLTIQALASAANQIFLIDYTVTDVNGASASNVITVTVSEPAPTSTTTTTTTTTTIAP